MQRQPVPEKYRKKPVVIEAMLYDGENATDVAEWCGGILVTKDDWDHDLGAWRLPNGRFVSPPEDGDWNPEDTFVVIETLEGAHVTRPHDRVIKGVEGEFYPIKPSQFASSYEPADAVAAQPQEAKTPHPAVASLLRYFEYHHLPHHLQEVSRPIGELALAVANELPDGPEKTAGLRKLLEAKDCFVRAALDKPQPSEDQAGEQG
jgi:hypothetical protein